MKIWRLWAWSLKCLLLLLGLSVLASAQVQAEERYYLLLFASQSSPRIPRYTHTFASFVRTVGEETQGPNCYLEAYPISWLPVGVDVHVLNPVPETGRNYGLHETLQVVLAEKQQVTCWGPYEIDRDLFDRALAKVALLQANEMKYKAIDPKLPGWNVSNCIHAISDLDLNHSRRHHRTLYCGTPSGYRISDAFQPHTIQRGQQHDWLIHRLGLLAYPLSRPDSKLACVK